MAVLCRLELRRAGPSLLRMGGWLAAGLVLGTALGEAGVAVFLLLAVGISVVIQVPAEAARDRITGDLLQLSVLPVPATTVVAGRFLAASLTSALAGLLYGVSGALASSAASPAVTVAPLPAAAGCFAAAWVGFTVSSFVAIAAVLRLRLQTLTNGSLALLLLGVLFGVGWLLERWVPDPWSRLEWLLSRSWLPPALALSALAAAVVVSWIAFRVAAVAIRCYRPEPDTLFW